MKTWLFITALLALVALVALVAVSAFQTAVAPILAAFGA